MFRKNRGSARIMLAGGGLLSLVVVIAIMSTLASKDADVTVKTKRYADEKVRDIQKDINERGRKAQRMMDRDPLSGLGGKTYQVVLDETGSDTRAVVRVVRSLTGLSLREAENLVDSAPVVVLSDLTRDDAKRARAALKRTGATATVEEQEQQQD